MTAPARCVSCGKPAAVDPTCGRCPACKHLVQVEAVGRLTGHVRPVGSLAATAAAPDGDRPVDPGRGLVEDEAARLFGGYVEPGDPGWTPLLAAVEAALRRRLATRQADVLGPAVRDGRAGGWPR